jgi:hypothetical protein
MKQTLRRKVKETKSSSPQKLSKSKVEEFASRIISLIGSDWKPTPILIENNVSEESFYQLCEQLDNLNCGGH